jgi:20S proteasome alpha/beta subunit
MVAGVDALENNQCKLVTLYHSGVSCQLLTTLSRPCRVAVYYVDSEGSCVEGDMFCVGSGSQIAYTVLDSVVLRALTKEEALHTALWAVKHATHRDGFSGGYINVLEVNSTGIFHVQRVDCRDLTVLS